MASVSSDAFKPTEVLGVDPLDFIATMQSMSCAASVVADFGEVNVKEFDGPPLAQRILGAIKEKHSLETLFPTTTHLNILLAKKTENKPWSHCNIAHTICVLAGEMLVSKVEPCTSQQVDDSNKDGYCADAKAAPKAPATSKDAGTTSLQAGDLMTCDGEQWYATGNDKPCLAVVFTVGAPMTGEKKLCKISLAKVAQLAKNGGGDWRLDADGKEIDWAADGALKNGEVVGQAPAPTAPSTTGAAPSPPVIVHGAFNAEEVLGTTDTAFGGVIRSLSTIMPMQVHFEPERITGDSGPGLVRRCVDAVTKLDAVKELLDNAGSDNVRLKMRFSGGGKFIHRNRYPRKQAFCLVSGEMTWFLVDSQNNAGAADEFLGCVQNDNWNGYRSPPHPKMLSLEEMAEMQEKLPAGVESRIIKMKAGDVLVFDGRWWHATNYNQQAFSIFLTPGKDMEVAVKEQERRRAMPKQAKLKICSFAEA